MVKQARGSGCLDSKLVELYCRAYDLPSVKGQDCIVMCEGLPDDKGGRYLSLGPEDPAVSEHATFAGSRPDG